MVPGMSKGKPPGTRNVKAFVHRSPALEHRILDELSTGKSLSKICAGPAMPTPAAVIYWTRDDEFRARFLEARRIGWQVMADRLVDDAAAELGSQSMPAVQARRLQIDTIKWILSKLVPEYAESVQHSHLVSGECRVQIYLPQKGSNAPVIDGHSELLEDSSDG
jgi:hypothetical protein